MKPGLPPSTPYPDVNAVLVLLLAGVKEVLGDLLVGLYVHGSLATGGYDPARSDIDFLVVTAGNLLRGMSVGPPASAALAARKSWRAPISRLRPSAVTTRLRPGTLIDPVSPDDLRRAVLGTLREWWRPQLEDHSRLRASEYQAYAVLTMARILYTLEHGTVVSKAVAARWAREALGEPWAALIRWAEGWWPGREPRVEGEPARPAAPDSPRLRETLDLIRHTIGRTEQERWATP